jgi:probable O-glycosylation ligase (exosortase A-associated)
MKGLIFTFLLCYGGALASLFRPYYGLLIYVCFFIIRPESLWFWSVPAGNYSRIIALALFIGWALNGFGNWQLGRAKSVIGYLIAFWVWQLISTAQADQIDVSLTWFESFSKVVLPLLVGITLIESVAQLKQLAWVIVLSHAYIAYDFNMSYYSGFNRLHDLGFGGMDNNCVAIAFVTCTGLAFFLGFNASKWWQKIIAFATIPLMVNAVFFAFSRGGMLGLIITAAISFVLIPKKPRHYLIFILALLLALRLAGPEVVERFTTVFADKKERDASAESRIQLWSACAKIMQEKPIFGLGPRNFPYHAHFYGFTRGKEAHSLWMTVGAETGVVGLALLIAFYAKCLLQLYPLARSKTFVGDPWFQESARMVIASITGFAISAQFVSVVGLETPYYVVLLGAGSLKLLSMPDTKASSVLTVPKLTPNLVLTR